MGKKKGSGTEAKLKLELANAKKFNEMVNTCEQQVATIQQCSDWPNQIGVQDAAKSVMVDATALKQTLIDHGTAQSTVVTLAGKRDALVSSLRRKHEALQVAVNLAGNGQKQALLAWGGTIVTRTSLPLSADAPVNATATITEIPGSVLTKCKADRAAYAYAFQYGADPANPDRWPQPVVESKASHLASDLPIGQKMYFRIAIFRRGVGQGQWSNLLEVLVR